LAANETDELLTDVPLVWIMLDIESILLMTVARLEGIFYRTQPFT
jgi:hypothetical protein